ncbi:MAG: hypothetical protein QXG50_04910 [Desulfurococcaceae archaeon]
MPRAKAELFKIVLNARGSIIITGPPNSSKTTVMHSILYSHIENVEGNSDRGHR